MFVGLALASAVILQIQAATPVWRLPEQGLSVTVPAGWRQIPDTNLRLNEAAVAQGGGGVHRMDVAFAREKATHWFDYPYVMVQVFDSGAVSPNDLAIQINSLAPQDSKSPLLSGRPSYGPATYDRGRDAVLWSIRTPLADGRRIIGYAASKATSRGFVSLYAYGFERDSLAVFGIRESFVDGFSIDGAHAYRALPPPVQPSQVASGNENGLELTLVGLACVVGLFGVVVMLLRAAGGRERN